MIFKSIIYTKPYSIEGFGTYMQEKAQVEIILEEGDTVQSAFIEAERQLDEWHNERKIKNAGVKELSYEEMKELIDKQPLVFVPGQKKDPPKEINLADERTEAAIDNASTLEQLEPLKVKCHTVPMFKRYQEKLKSLK